MKRGIKLRVLALIGIGLAVLLPATPVFADTSNPSPDPDIVSFNVYHHILETDDFLVLIYANIPYSTLPDTPVTETFIWRMINTDNITILGSTVGYAFNDDGYGYNVYSMYWSAANVTSLHIVWDTSYFIRLNGNPTVFDDPPEYQYSLDSTDYTTFDDSSGVRSEMGTRILDIANDLYIKWVLDPATSLTAEIESGTVLSLRGETVFRGSIRGVQGMVPQIFAYVIQDMEVTARDWDTVYTENLTAQWAGTWVGTAKDAGAALFGTDYDLPSLLLMTGMALGMVVCSLMVGGGSWGGLVDSSLVVIMGARLALFGLGYLGLIAALCMLYISARIWGIARG